jgi:DNA-binding NarL/FixJ family response regulator
MKIRVVLADNHILVRDGIKSLLEREGFQIVGEAGDGQELVRIAEELQPEVAVLDIGMPLMNGLVAARELKRACPKTKTILLTRHDEDQYVIEALRAGISRIRPEKSGRYRPGSCPPTGLPWPSVS